MCHKLDRTKGLDLILHTGGGDIGAVESLVFYIHEMFGQDVRAIVPQLAMSAGAMIACSCATMVMGKHSAIGPVDPQISGLPAVGVLQEWERAREEIKDDERHALVWDPILGRITPSFLEQCRWAVDRSVEFLGEALRDGMFRDAAEPEKSQAIERIVERLTTHDKNRGHNRHIQYQECIDLGLKVTLLENPSDKTFQDLVLTVHHTFMHTLSNTGTVKIIENHLGRAHVRAITMQPAVAPNLSLPPEFLRALLQEQQGAEMNRQAAEALGDGDEDQPSSEERH